MDNASSATDIDPENTTTRLQDVDVCNLVMKSPDEKSEFLPVYRSGSCCAEQGQKQFIVCIDDLVDHLGAAVVEWSSLGAFYGVFDGHGPHGGTDAALFVRKNILRFIVEESYFPLCVKKAIKSAFLKADYEFADDSSLNISSGTTALILGRRLIIANAGACRAVLGRKGRAIELSKDHKPNCTDEKVRIEKFGVGHMKGPRGSACPLTPEPELQETELSEEDEFLIMGCDGLWDVMSSQCAVTFARKELMIHNDPERCSRELEREALKGNTCDSLTVIVVCFSSKSALERIPSDLFKVIVSCLSYKEALVIKLASKYFDRQVKLLPDQVCANGKSLQSFRESLLKNDQDARVCRFSLKLKSRDIDEVVVNDCLVNVLNRGVLDFELDINVSRDYRLPVSLFTCSTVVNLKLGSGFEIDIPQDGLLPSVKSIMLDSITFSGGEMFNKLLEKCPSLETLEKNGKRFYTTVTMRLLGRPYNEYSKNIFHHGQGRFYKYSEKKRLCVRVIKIPAFKDEISEIGRILDTFTNLERLEIGIPGMLTPDLYLSTVQGLLALPRASPRCKIVVTKF